MAVVANLDAVLGAKVEQFTRGIDGAIVTTGEMQKQLKAAGLTQRDWNKIVKEGAAVTARMQTPLEIYEQEIRDLARLLKVGEISQETYNRAVRESKTTLDASSKSHANHNRLLQDAARVTAAVRTPLEIYEQEIRELNVLLKSSEISQETYNRAVRKSKTTLDASSKSHANHNRLLQDAARVTAAVRTPLEIYEQELRELNVLLQQGAINQTTFNRAVLAGQSQLAASAATTTSAVNRLAATTVSYGKSLGPLALIGIGIKLGSDAIALEEQLTKSAAIIGGINDQLRDDLVEGALIVSRETKFSAEQAAEAYFFLFSAGLDAAQSIEALPQVAKFAQAGAFDLAKATDLATDAQSAFGLVSKDNVQNLENLTRVTDALIAGNSLFNASGQQVSEAITNKTAAAFRFLGKDIEEAVAVLAFLPITPKREMTAARNSESPCGNWATRQCH